MVIINEEQAIKEIQKLGFEAAASSYIDDLAAETCNHSSRFWRIPSENFKLKDTPFYKNTENDYVHFTSMKNLVSILNSKCLRMYNLEGMEDKFEMEHIRKKLKYPEFIKFDKKQLYCLSMCCTSVLKSKEKEHFLWKLHGRNGRGVMIRFSFQNDLERWYNYHLTKVFYDYKVAKPILRLNELTKREYLDAKVGCFLKLPIYKFENETRLLFDNRINSSVTKTDRDGNLIYPIIHHETRKNFDDIFYVELPIWNFNRNNDELYKAPNVQGIDFEIPKVQINEIVAGYNVDEFSFEKLAKKCQRIDSSIRVKITKLKKYY